MTETKQDSLAGLLPCPFCGAKGKVVKNSFPPRNRFRHPSCTNENCIAYISEQDEQGGTNCDFITDAEAVAAWNRRPALAAQTAPTHDANCGCVHGPEPCDCRLSKTYPVAAQTAASREAPREGFTLVPDSALRWLMGEEGDFEPSPTGPFSKRGAFWWRSEFRKRIALADLAKAAAEYADGVGANDPRKALAELIQWEVKLALDPRVSSDAAALIQQGAAQTAASRKAGEDYPGQAYFHERNANIRNAELAALADRPSQGGAALVRVEKHAAGAVLWIGDVRVAGFLGTKR